MYHTEQPWMMGEGVLQRAMILEHAYHTNMISNLSDKGNRYHANQR